MLITFEGIEGCGKSTQIKMFCDKLRRDRMPFVSIREPGGTQLSELIRSLLLSNDLQIGREAELLLFQASRSELMEKVLMQALEKNSVVVCDRFTDSTVAYQGFGRGISRRIIRNINAFVTRNIQPDRTYLLDMPVELMHERVKHKHKDRMENESEVFHGKVRRGFLDIARRNPDRVLTIDATLSPSKIHAIICRDFRQIS